MNSKSHLVLSLIKSAFRVLGCAAVLVGFSITYLGIFFGLAEILGVLEELVDKR